MPAPSRAHATSEPSPPARTDRRLRDRRVTAIQVVRFPEGGPERRRSRRRTSERRGVRLPVELRHKGVTSRARTTDLSLEGAGLLDAPPLPVGALVRLTLPLPDELPEVPVVAWAQVVSVQPHLGLVGVRFAGLRACDARRLGRLLARPASSP